jgi:predicted transcriptional regulator of viral defense system
MKNNNKNYKQRIIKALEENNGMITAAYCKENGIPNIYLKNMVEKGRLIRVSRGIYATHNTILDDYYVFQLRYTRCIYSFLSALYLQGMTDRVPETKEVTVFKGYNASRIEEQCIVHYTSKAFYDIGKTTVFTMFGNVVFAYDKERTICDLIRNRKDIDPEIFVKALNRYMRSKDKKLNKLMEYARVFKIEKKTLELIEVLYE